MPTKGRKTTSKARARRSQLKIVRSERDRRNGTAPAGKAEGPLAAVTVAAKELKDRAVATGRKMDLKKAAPVAAAVTAVVATGLLWRKRKK